MTDNQPGRPAERPDNLVRRHFERKREKMRSEIARNREGNHKVPTWALWVILIVILGGWLALIFLS